MWNLKFILNFVDYAKLRLGLGDRNAEITPSLTLHTFYVWINRFYRYLWSKTLLKGVYWIMRSHHRSQRNKHIILIAQAYVQKISLPSRFCPFPSLHFLAISFLSLPFPSLKSLLHKQIVALVKIVRHSIWKTQPRYLTNATKVFEKKVHKTGNRHMKKNTNYVKMWPFLST